MIRSRLRSIALAFLCTVAAAQAQTAITSIITTTTDARNTTVNGVTFDNTTVALSSFSDSSGNSYTYSSTGVAAYIRRNNSYADANQTSAWYAVDPNNSSRMLGTYSSTASSLLLGNNLTRGSDNTFANGTSAQQGNIERVDFILNNKGVTATSDMAFAVFDRGDAGVHDGFKIVLITGFNATTGQVTAYSSLLLSATSASYGSTNVTGDATYDLYRYSNGNNLSSWDDNTESSTQGIGGVVFNLSDFGVAAGTTIYGYSIVAADTTTGGSTANLIDWTNSNYYPTDTSDATGTTGLDLAAVNGVLFHRSPVPEPSTYGAGLVGTALIVLIARRRHQTGRPA